MSDQAATARRALPHSTKIGVLVVALIWLGFGVITALGLHPSLPPGPVVRWGMAAMAAAAGSLILLLYWFADRSRAAYLLLLAVLIVISMLTLADEFGMADLLVLALHVAAALSLVAQRGRYLHRMPATDSGPLKPPMPESRNPVD